ncbi:MAG TPA: hypothetical protein VE262_13250 [Blastocatellia bacterium]|nr:hypothetical protein [Blastocatellia bacterium]
MRNHRAIKIKRVVAVAAVSLMLGLLACREAKRTQPAPSESPQPERASVESPFNVVVSKTIEKRSPFDHNRPEHRTRAQDCNACHERADNDVVPKFPGHRACIECHVQDMSSSTSELCVICHVVPVDGKLISFPEKLGEFGLKGFSHKTHLDPSKMPSDADAGKCDRCHRFDPAGVNASFPAHEQCYSCHAHQAGQQLSECRVCHSEAATASKGSRGLGSAFRLYNFRHASHTGKVDCARCHKTSDAGGNATRPDIMEISTASGQRHSSACWSCHVRAREAVCTKCHTGALPF